MQELNYHRPNSWENLERCMKANRRLLRHAGIAIGGLLLLWQTLNAVQVFFNGGVHIAYPVFFLPALFLIALSYAVPIISWKIIMQGLGVTIPWKPLIRGYVLSSLPRYLPGSVWTYLSRGEWLLLDYQVSYPISTKGSILEIMIALFSSGLLGGTYFIIQANLMAPHWVIPVFLSLAVLSWALLKTKLKSHWAIRHLSSVTSDPIGHPLMWVKNLVLITSAMFSYGMALYLTYRALNFDSNPFAFDILFAFAAIFSTAWIIGFVVFFLPSGLGLREVALASLLTLNLGIPFESTSMVSILFRLAMIIAELFWVGIGLIFGWINTRSLEVERNEKSETE